MDVAASGVELVTSDAYQGWNAIAVVFAGASWQRCRTHFMANLRTRVPKRTLLRLSKGRRGHHGTHHLPATVSRRGPRPTGPSGGTTPGAFSQVAELLADAAPDILAFTAFPVAH